ncbi:hypothetical protein H4R33_005538 [Dimargaris cristalligena]|uniref:Uncharacterized protein n=1 Tax=Dimargaris cristalligena TaxID=215637 RepID=A0A4Q0A064_9FUNG|nr:hypothetical protein H4R33_005538 [Dimargaris cristalligena]RKP39377.1 hypothetical protein BJ085DRAFT_27958 [Dimargaris cristalligena]|eukprot:RKP39377.1 hypothetical protein BJ085DRAFT_27958 [Dimargaris cristalligena]
MRFSTTIALFGLAVLASTVMASPAGPAEGEAGAVDFDDDDNTGLFDTESADDDASSIIGKRDFQQTKEKSGMIGMPIIFGAKGQKTWLERQHAPVHAARPAYRQPAHKSYAPKYRRDFQQTKEKSGMIGFPIIFGTKGQKTWLERPAEVRQAPVHAKPYAPKHYGKY